MPLLGVGSFLVPQTGTWLLTAVPLASLLAGGIVIADFGSFIGTPSGAKFVKEQCPSFRLCPGDTMYVPYGWLPIMTMTIDLSQKIEKGALGHFLVFHLLSTKLACSLTKHVWDGVAAHLQSFLVGKKDVVWLQVNANLAALCTGMASASE